MSVGPSVWLSPGEMGGWGSVYVVAAGGHSWWVRSWAFGSGLALNTKLEGTVV